MEGYNKLQMHLKEIEGKKGRNVNGHIKYATIHSRWLEGNCEKILGKYLPPGQALPPDECYWETHVKRILRQSSVLGQIPIVVITDMQNKRIIKLLQDDPEIGHDVVVPALELNLSNKFPGIDMMIAINSDVLLGTRMSTMAVMIGLVRVLQKKDPESNFIYIKDSKETDRPDHFFDVCTECIFFCNRTESPICGSETVFVRK